MRGVTITHPERVMNDGLDLTKRELVRYVKRTTSGRFKESEDVARSLASDKPRRARESN